PRVGRGNHHGQPGVAGAPVQAVPRAVAGLVGVERRPAHEGAVTEEHAAVQQHPSAEQAGLDLLAPGGARPGVEGGEDADGGDPPPGSVMTSSLAGIPTATTVPAARAMSKACTMSSGRPTTSKVTSAPRPSVNARTASTGSASAGSTAWVAPTRRLASRRPAAGSTARMVAAPAMRAPWTTDWPTP